MKPGVYKVSLAGVGGLLVDDKKIIFPDGTGVNLLKDVMLGGYFKIYSGDDCHILSYDVIENPSTLRGIEDIVSPMKYTHTKGDFFNGTLTAFGKEGFDFTLEYIGDTRSPHYRYTKMVIDSLRKKYSRFPNGKYRKIGNGIDWLSYWAC